MIKVVKPKERETIIRSLSAGVVPRIGIQHIHVGRSEELKSFVRDIDNIADGGTSFRFVIGEYGSGKTFFMSLTRSIALEKGLVTVNADLSPSKRLYSSDGHARVLLTELISSVSTRTKQDGNALVNILEKFISVARDYAVRYGVFVTDAISEMLKEFYEYPNGYSFTQAIIKYWEAYESGNDIVRDNTLRWLRAEYTTKTDSLRDLGIREILNDSSFFNTLILYSILVRKAGYKGLLVCLDEMVNLYRIPNSVSRNLNYENILSILNNTLQGNLSNIGFIMCGTPEFLLDTKKGVYSYEALKSRLAENTFSQKLGVVDYNSIVLRLENLTKEELYLLLSKIRHVYAMGNEKEYLVPDTALVSYMNYCYNKVGDCYFRTPRNTIKGFLDLLSILEQYPNKEWTDIIEEVEIEKDIESTEIGELLSIGGNLSSSDEEEFATFRI